MKKLFTLMLLFMAAVMTTATFTSCGDDDDDNTPSVAGSYTGKDELDFSVMGQSYKQSNTAEVNYIVTQNNDGSISVVIPEETFDYSAVKMGNMSMGSIVQGTYSVTNIPYDKAKNVYYLDYSNKVSAEVLVYGNKKNYTVTEGKITVSFSGNKVTVVNVHRFGNMPMGMTGTFVGTRK